MATHSGRIREDRKSDDGSLKSSDGTDGGDLNGSGSRSGVFLLDDFFLLLETGRRGVTSGPAGEMQPVRSAFQSENLEGTHLKRAFMFGTVRSRGTLLMKRWKQRRAGSFD